MIMFWNCLFDLTPNWEYHQKEPRQPSESSRLSSKKLRNIFIKLQRPIFHLIHDKTINDELHYATTMFLQIIMFPRNLLCQFHNWMEPTEDESFPLFLGMFIFFHSFYLVQGYFKIVLATFRRYYLRHRTSVRNLFLRMFHRLLGTSSYGDLYETLFFDWFISTSSTVAQRSCAFTTVTQIFTADELKQYQSHTSYDTDGIACILDNSANAHIWSIRSSFVTFQPIDSCKVATIGGTDHRATGIGTVKASWQDDNGKSHTYELQNVLYFPDSPVNIISITAFANQLNDDDGTNIMTARHHSVFQWNFAEYQRTFTHSPTTNLPEIIVNEGYNTFASFCNSISSRCNYHHCALASDCSNELSSIEDNHSSDEFHIGSKVKYINDNLVDNVIICNIATADATSPTIYTIELSSGDITQTTIDFLRSNMDTDVADIPLSDADYINRAQQLSLKELEFIKNPRPYDSLEQEYLDLHNQLQHIDKQSFF